jgi:predicted Zn-dependent peptidase
MEDLDRATIEDVKKFFKTYYAPNNAVLALVGDLDTRETLEKVKKYFGGIPRQEPPRQVDFSQPDQTAERREVIPDPLARLARISYAYRIPPANSPDIDALTMMNTILANGQSSRLYQRLVKETESAQQVSGSVDDRIGPGLYYLTAMVRPGKSAGEVEKLLNEEIAKLQAEAVTEAELQRARTSARRAAVSTRTSALARAQRLADDAVIFDDPGRMNTLEKRRMAVTAAQIQEAAKKYLKPTNRTVVITEPAARGGRTRPSER